MGWFASLMLLIGYTSHSLNPILVGPATEGAGRVRLIP